MPAEYIARPTTEEPTPSSTELPSIKWNPRESPYSRKSNITRSPSGTAWLGRARKEALFRISIRCGRLTDELGLVSIIVITLVIETVPPSADVRRFVGGADPVIAVSPVEADELVGRLEGAKAVDIALFTSSSIFLLDVLEEVEGWTAASKPVLEELLEIDWRLNKEANRLPLARLSTYRRTGILRFTKLTVNWYSVWWWILAYVAFMKDCGAGHSCDCRTQCKWTRLDGKVGRARTRERFGVHETMSWVCAQKTLQLSYVPCRHTRE